MQIVLDWKDSVGKFGTGNTVKKNHCKKLKFLEFYWCHFSNNHSYIPEDEWDKITGPKYLQNYEPKKPHAMWWQPLGHESDRHPGPSQRAKASPFTSVIGHMPEQCRQLDDEYCYEWRRFIVLAWVKRKERLSICVQYEQTSQFQGSHCTKQKERSKLKSQHEWW